MSIARMVIPKLKVRATGGPIRPKKTMYYDPNEEATDTEENDDTVLGTEVAPTPGIQQSVMATAPIFGTHVDPTNNMGMAADKVSGASGEATPPLPSKKVKLGQVLGQLAPFASNIANGFRTPPMPIRGVPQGYVSMKRVNLGNERNIIRTTYGAADKAAERTVDGNTAEAIKAFNRGNQLDKLNQVSERETNTNVGIGNQEAMVNAQIDSNNTRTENKYRDELVERKVAQQRESSANLANAGDKSMIIANENSKRKTELDKAKVLASMYDKSGVLKRWGEEQRKAGNVDPRGEDWKWTEKIMANGGVMRMNLPTRKVK